MNAAYLTPAITLFNEDGTLDLASQERLFNNLIDQGVDGILVEGSSSEFFAMPMNQRREMAKFAIEKIDHRVKLIIGTSHMVADEIISFSNFCLDAGADAVMILPPYYFHFGPSALLQYYDRLAEQIHGDIYIYNFPDNTGYTIPPETVLALAKMHPNIVGMKDTVPGMDHTRELIKVVKSQIPSSRSTPALTTTSPTMYSPAATAASAPSATWCRRSAPPGSAPSGRTTWPASPEASRPSTV